MKSKPKWLRNCISELPWLFKNCLCEHAFNPSLVYSLSVCHSRLLQILLRTKGWNASLSMLCYQWINYYRGAPGTCEVGESVAPQLRKFILPRKFGNHVTVHHQTEQPTERPSVRTTGIPNVTDWRLFWWEIA